MPKRKRKQYSKPRRRYDKVRMDEESLIKERYGLKNKKEIWKADAKIKKIREAAKGLVTGKEEDKKVFIEKLNKKGFKVGSIADALALNKEDWLKRRLQTMVYSKGFANTINQARQFVVHKHISIGNQKVNIPSYQVDLEEENKIKINLSFKLKEKKKSKEEEIKEELEKESKDDAKVLEEKKNEKSNKNIEEEEKVDESEEEQKDKKKDKDNKSEDKE